MIWLTGCKGMLGAELAGLLSSHGMSFFGTDIDCDIANPDALRGVCEGKNVSWIVNCAGYTAVDRAEEEPEVAMRINAEGPGTLAMQAETIGARLIHVSTDYVFDGCGSVPYTEDDPVNPIGVYGRSKAEGDVRLRESCSRHFILRTAWMYGRYGKNFANTMLGLMAERESIGVVADQRGSPTWARDLAGAILDIIARDACEYGTYHYTDEGDISWYDFAMEIQRLGLRYGLLPRRIPVLPLKTDEYPARAKRPAYSVLSKGRIRNRLGIDVPSWETSLDRYIASLAEAHERRT